MERVGFDPKKLAHSIVEAWRGMLPPVCVVLFARECRVIDLGCVWGMLDASEVIVLGYNDDYGRSVQNMMLPRSQVRSK